MIRPFQGSAKKEMGIKPDTKDTSCSNFSAHLVVNASVEILALNLFALGPGAICSVPQGYPERGQ